MPDPKWKPEVVEKVARGLIRHSYAGCGFTAAQMDQIVDVEWPEQKDDAVAALDASPLPDVLDLIERIGVCVSKMVGHNASEANSLSEIQADAAAFVARVREG